MNPLLMSDVVVKRRNRHATQNIAEIIHPSVAMCISKHKLLLLVVAVGLVRDILVSERRRRPPTSRNVRCA